MEEAKVSIISDGSSPTDVNRVHVSKSMMQHPPVAAASTTATSPPVLSWMEYLDDPVLLHILSYLNVKELRQGPLWVNRRFYQLIVTNEVLWKELYRREYWPTMTCSATNSNDVARATWVVDMNLNSSLLMGGTIPDIARDSNHDRHSQQPSHDTSSVAHDTTTTTTNAPTINNDNKIVNYPLLFSLACHSHREPTCINNELIFITRGLEEIEFLPVAVPSQGDENIPAYRFTGQVGPGNRCIRADRALPRPIVVSIQDEDNEDIQPNINEVNPQNNDNNLLNYDDMVPQHNNHNNPQNNNHDTLVPPPIRQPRPRRTKWMVPFVSPLHKVSTSGQAEIHLTPRLIAYFEVTLHPPPPPPANQPSVQEQQAEALQNILRQQQQAAAAGRQRHWIRRRDLFLLAMAHEQDHDRQECIAVGIGTERFAFDHRMPGWDRYSYGYHGDDGGLYHGSGHFRANRSRLPRFGVGDTVGCGIDYAQRSLFFTLNGTFLGYHFGPNHDDDYGDDGDNDFLFHQDFYPVVGMDATCCVSVNFGQERPFVFDLTTTMIPKDRAVMEHVIQRLPRCYLYNDSDDDDDDEEEDDDEDEDDDAFSSGEDDDEVFDYFGFGRHDPDGSDDSNGGNNDMDNEDDDDDSTSLDDHDDDDYDDNNSEREQMQFSSESEDGDDDGSEFLGF